MKKTKTLDKQPNTSIAKLTLKRTTLRQLDDKQLAQVAGGFIEQQTTKRTTRPC